MNKWRKKQWIEKTKPDQLLYQEKMLEFDRFCYIEKEKEEFNSFKREDLEKYNKTNPESSNRVKKKE